MRRSNKTTPEPAKPSELLVPRTEADSKITERIEKGEKLKMTNIASRTDLDAVRNDYYKWSTYNEELLKRIFSDENLSDEYSHHLRVFTFDGTTPTLREDTQELHQDIDRDIHSLESIRERLDIIPEAVSSPMTKMQAENQSSNTSSKVFIVHGHDEACRESVARFLEQQGIQPIILHEQASKGRTIIEKLEAHADVDFAIVLLTPDDVGSVADSQEPLKPRARQNVILELGYFIGKLGRDRVCAIHKDSVALPSDILGVVYVPFDRGSGWKLLLGKELREAGIAVDLNKV
jgi:predicted nucleotide-binding protein